LYVSAIENSLTVEKAFTENALNSLFDSIPDSNYVFVNTKKAMLTFFEVF
jgi:hypothetical protein